MPDKTLLIFLSLEALFIGTGVLLLAVAVLFNGKDVSGPLDIATNLLLNNCSLNVAIANAVLIFVTALVAIPGVINSKDRKILRLHSWMILVCGGVSLIVGLVIWFFTLKTRSNLLAIYESQSSDVHKALQNHLQCCGYLDADTPLFVTDNTCTNHFIAARLGPCIGPFSSYANILLDTIFTALFGLVAVDGLLFLSTLVMLKKRDEIERYAIIDRKYGIGGI